MKFSIGKFDVTMHFRARRAWTDAISRRLECGGKQLVWGRLSLSIEDGTTECIATCAQCGDEDVSEVTCGDEGWTVCRACRSIEGGRIYISKRQARL
jgi:hypothetical protein